MTASGTCNLDIEILVMCAGLIAKLDIIVSILNTCKTTSSSSSVDFCTVVVVWYSWRSFELYVEHAHTLLHLQTSASWCFGVLSFFLSFCLLPFVEYCWLPVTEFFITQASGSVWRRVGHLPLHPRGLSFCEEWSQMSFWIFLAWKFCHL